jgi:hypothetical protein
VERSSFPEGRRAGRRAGRTDRTQEGQIPPSCRLSAHLATGREDVMLWLVHTAEGKTSRNRSGFRGLLGPFADVLGAELGRSTGIAERLVAQSFAVFSVVVRAFASRVRIPPSALLGLHFSSGRERLHQRLHLRGPKWRVAGGSHPGSRRPRVSPVALHRRRAISHSARRSSPDGGAAWAHACRVAR